MSVAAPSRAAPFTVEHFARWVEANELTLESGDEWVVEPFQLELLADVLSPVRECWAILPEGNAKTTLMAGVALYAADHVRAPWIPVGAASRDQAEIMFGQAGGFVERSELLKERFRVFEGYRRIKHRENGGRGIKVYPWDPGTGDGVIPFPIAFLDELHRHPDLRLYRLWKGKLRKRGATIRAISVAGEPGSEFEEVRELIRNNAVERRRDGCHLRAVGAGIVYHEWMVPAVEQARDLAVVKDANPLSQIDEEYLAEKLASDTLDFGEDWLRLTCNIPSRSSQAAIPETTWDLLQTDEVIPEGVPIAVGADFGWLLDTTAIVPLWVRDESFRLFGSPSILKPPGGGVMLDVEEVKEAFRHLHRRNPIDIAVVDKSRAEDVTQWLEAELGITVVDHSQGVEMQVIDYDRWMAAIREKTLRHTGDREFRQHVLNAVAALSAGGKRRFDRPHPGRGNARKQPRRVIDALRAATMVHTVATDMLVRPAGFSEPPVRFV